MFYELVSMGTDFAGEEPELLLLLLSPLVVTSDWAEAEEFIELWLVFVDGACPSSASFLRRFMTVGRNLVDKERSPGSCYWSQMKHWLFREIINENNLKNSGNTDVGNLLIPLHVGILLKYLTAPTRLWKQGIQRTEHRATEDFCHKRSKERRERWVGRISLIWKTNSIQKNG